VRKEGFFCSLKAEKITGIRYKALTLPQCKTVEKMIAIENNGTEGNRGVIKANEGIPGKYQENLKKDVQEMLEKNEPKTNGSQLSNGKETNSFFPVPDQESTNGQQTGTIAQYNHSITQARVQQASKNDSFDSPSPLIISNSPLIINSSQPFNASLTGRTKQNNDSINGEKYSSKLTGTRNRNRTSTVSPFYNQTRVNNQRNARPMRRQMQKKEEGNEKKLFGYPAFFKYDCRVSLLFYNEVISWDDDVCMMWLIS